MTSFALADDVMRQVDESKQLVLVGLSMGSAIGATITSLWPESVRAALHIAPAWFDEVEFPREPSEDAEAGPSHEPPGTRRAWEPLRAVGPIVGWSEADRQHYRSEFTKAAPDASLAHTNRVTEGAAHRSPRPSPARAIGGSDVER